MFAPITCVYATRVACCLSSRPTPLPPLALLLYTRPSMDRIEYGSHVFKLTIFSRNESLCFPLCARIQAYSRFYTSQCPHSPRQPRLCRRRHSTSLNSVPLFTLLLAPLVTASHIALAERFNVFDLSVIFANKDHSYSSFLPLLVFLKYKPPWDSSPLRTHTDSPPYTTLN